MKPGRRSRYYFKEIEMVESLNMGEAHVFQIKHPWGFAKKLYEYLHKQGIHKEFNIRISIPRQEVVVMRGYRFV